MLLIASDHGGYELKHALLEWFEEEGIAYHDLGTDSSDSVDYPDYARLVAEQIASGEAERGILICGTGIGMAITANKIPGIRAAQVHDEFTARMAREHNDANILVLGGRVLQPATARLLVRTWLDASYAGGRHQRRLDKIAALDRD